MSGDEHKIWVLADDRAGNRAQSLGVAEALNRPYVIKEISYGPLAALPNAVMPPTFGGLSVAAKGELRPPWPELVITAGRRTAPVARRIKRMVQGQPRLLQIMNPGGPLGDFDLVCIPSHDPSVNADNVIGIVGAPHGMTADRLSAAREQWIGRLKDLTPPYIALVVGGTTRRRRFSDAMALELAEMASALALAAGGSLLVTTSRRTGDVAETLISNLRAPARVYRWTDGGENPYAGFLACAETIIVTGESISMCSEACAGQGPVYIYAPAALITEKHRRFHQTLYDTGYARALDGTYEHWQHERLNSADDIAQAIERIVS